MTEDREAQFKTTLKTIIHRLHDGEDPEAIKSEFKVILAKVTAGDISRVEEELIAEGMPREEVHRLCDVHLALFQERLDTETTIAPPGHPVHVLMEEHKRLVGLSTQLRDLIREIRRNVYHSLTNEQREQLTHLLGTFKESQAHYLREENVLFPYLEKKGITQPPAIMWMEHDRIRDLEKHIYTHVDQRDTMRYDAFIAQLVDASTTLAELLVNHFYKENNILFPTALDVITDHEWGDVRAQFDEIGYCSFTPAAARVEFRVKAEPVVTPSVEGVVPFETGALTWEEIEAILNTLPLDVTYVDKDDTVRYFSQARNRIFVRTKAVIGRKVQQCHPQTSVHIVEQILDTFKSGSRDVADFWITLNERLILIRFYPLRTKRGAYLGCIEVTQDITDLQTIEGEKRLLDWT
jgi:DUF438 domain-containing protein